MRRSLLVICLAIACAPASGDRDWSPRALTAEQTQCESGGVTITNITETDDGERWTASCYGRFFTCEKDREGARCSLAKASGVSADQLAVRLNTCLSGQKQICHNLAIDFELGRNGVPPDRLAAIEVYGYSCQFGNSPDCTRGRLLKKNH